MCIKISFPLKGRHLWVLALGRFPNQHKIGIPEFKYVANMHGDEVRLLLQLLQFPLQPYLPTTLEVAHIVIYGIFDLKNSDSYQNIRDGLIIYL